MKTKKYPTLPEIEEELMKLLNKVTADTEIIKVRKYIYTLIKKLK